MISRRAFLALALAAVFLVQTASSGHAEGATVGFSITVEGDGFILNPVVTKILISDVVKGSLADKAGIVKGDEIIQIENHAVVGARGRDLQAYMKFGAGETRKLRLKHSNGEKYEASLTKPKA